MARFFGIAVFFGSAVVGPRGRQTSLQRNRRRPPSLGSVERLEPREMLDGSVIISEVMARNDEVLQDEDGDSPDWIELLNISSETVDLNGWHLTDDAENLNNWQFPPVSLNPGEHLIVFASGKDRDNPLRPLHADFKLTGDGEYLALTRPDETIEFEFAPDFPPQVEDVSYGVPNQVSQAFLVDEGASASVYIPTDGRLDPANLAEEQIQGSWLDPALDTRFTSRPSPASTALIRIPT